MTCLSNSVTALVGKSGCGKSTFLRLLAGLEDVQSGKITTDAKIRIGAVFQEPALMPWATVTDNISLPFTLRGEKISATHLETILEKVNLSGFQHRYPSQLSGGQKMRVAIARALVEKPDVLLMDEPFAALDEPLRFQMNDLLLELQNDMGVGLLFITHSIYEAVYLADTVHVMTGGTLSHCVRVPHDRNLPPQEQRAQPAFTEIVRTLSRKIAGEQS